MTDFDFNAQSPKWSPDGQWILFQGQGDLHTIRPDGSDKRIVAKHRLGEPKWLGGWSPDGKQVVYLQWGFIGMQDRIVVATLDMNLLNVVTEEEVPVAPLLAIQSVSFGADGRSILFVGSNADRASSFRVRLDTHELIQLTDAPFSDYSLQEWGRRLSVSPKQRALPQTWGRVKAKVLE